MKLLEILTNSYDLPQVAAQFLKTNLVAQTLPKHTLLLAKGQVCNCIYFLETGMARGFYNEKSEESTSWFVQSGDFIYSPYSFLKQLPTRECVELLEDSVVVAIPLVALNHIYDTYPSTVRIGLSITEKYMLLYDQRAYSLRCQSAEQRLKGFMENYPDIYAKAQKKHVASYLGMDNGTLSRILSGKHKE